MNIADYEDLKLNFLLKDHDDIYDVYRERELFKTFRRENGQVKTRVLEMYMYHNYCTVPVQYMYVSDTAQAAVTACACTTV